MNKFILTAAAGLLALSANGANAAPIFINFDAIALGAAVNGFYDGGTDSDGETGPNLGVQFIGWVTATGFGETSQPNLAYDFSTPATIDVAAGFYGLVSFTQGFYAPGNVSIYSGLNGTGSLLASYDLPASDPYAFAPVDLEFSGMAESVVFTDSVSAAGELGIDDLTLGVPEPGTFALFAAGLLGLAGINGFGRRKARMA